MEISLSVRVLFCCLSSSALIALPACGRSDDNTIEAPASVTSTDAAQDIGKQTMLEKGTNPILAFGELHTGETTYYRATGDGNCSFGTSDDLMVAAINSKDYADAAMCGAYLLITGPAGTVTARVVDRCPGCKPGGLDLSQQAFERIAAKGTGRVPVTWQITAGPVSGPIVYHYKDGSTRYWTAIQLRNHRWPIASLEIMPKGGGDWINVQRRPYNYFVYPGTIAAGPLRVRVKAVTGAVLEDELPEPKGGLLVQGAAQFQ